jgi:hypothetical protein
MDQQIQARAKANEANEAQEYWNDLRHYLERLYSYRQATESILNAKSTFPELFQKFIITPIPSSRPSPRPLPRSPALTADNIIKRMLSEDEDSSSYISLAEASPKIFLNMRIQEQVAKRGFRPVVHAEILVHDYILNLQTQDTARYWNNWKYIGVSKPTCRLCHYYFDEHPDRVQVRRSHLNLYPNWRFPEVSDQDHIKLEIRNELLESITENIRDDAKNTLLKQIPLGRKHDSSTYSAPSGYPNFNTTYSVSEASSAIANMTLSSSGNVSRASTQGIDYPDHNIRVDGEEDGEGGASLFGQID